MKNSFKLVSTLCLMLVSGSVLFAQDSFKAAYFLDGYSHRYKMNPALAPERGFFNPVIGNINAGVNSNLSLSNLMWKDENGTLNTILAANTPEGIAQLPDGYGLMDANLNTSLLSVGWWNKAGTVFSSFDLGLKGNASMKIGQTFLDMLREKSPSRDYAFEPMGLGADAQAEFAYGMAIKKNWFHFGLRAKVLGGLAKFNMYTDEINANLTVPGIWSVEGTGGAEFYMPKSFVIPTKGEIDSSTPAERANRLKFSEMTLDPKKFFPSGVGAGLDLGIGFDFGQYFSLYGGVNNLGFMAWFGGEKAVMPSTSWTSNAYDGVIESLLGFKDQSDAVMDIIDEFFPFERTDEKFNTFEMLPMNVNAGMNLKMPFYEPFQVGIVGTADIVNKSLTHAEGRLIASITLADCFDIAADYSYMWPMGHSAGLLFNLHMAGINFFLGTDSIVPVFAWKNGIPAAKLSTSASFGLNITFGKLR